MKHTVTAASIVLVPTTLFGLTFSLLLLPADEQLAAAGPCTAASTRDIRPNNLPIAEVGGYSGEQMVNAALIINAGEALDLGAKGQAIGLMAAMGESSLQVLDHGDGAGPDSRGLFQQRDNGQWGSYEDRMDPTISATNFFEALQAVEGWGALSPTEAAHRAQRNADPFHYEQYWDDAVNVVAAVTGVEGLETCLTGPLLTGKGDDLPWPNAPYCPIGGTCPPNAVSPLGMYNRECTDFALWRLNAMAAVTSEPWKFHNTDLALGNAETWINAWYRQGWDTGQEPRVGAVAYYAANVGGAGPVGHVAIVSAISDDGTVIIEEYNGQAPPDDHQYGIRSIDPGEPTAYLYFPGDE